MMDDPLSVERLRLARETLTAAFRAVRDGFPGAIDADPEMAFSEAKRNLTALTGWKHGTEAWEAALDE